MKHVLPLALLLIAVAIALYVFLGGSEDSVFEADSTSEDVAPPATSDLEHRGLEGTAPKGGRVPKKDNSDLMTRHKTRYGSLEILPIGPDGNTLPPDGLTVAVEPLGRSHRIGRPLGLRDSETHLWTFGKIPIGDVKIRVHGDYVIPADDQAKVREGQRTHKKVFVELAGAIKYDVKLYDGTQPDKVTLTLLNMAGKPVTATYQVRTREHLTNATITKSITQKPFGYIFGVRPGTYRLRVTSPEGETETVTVDVQMGQETRVDLEVRR